MGTALIAAALAVAVAVVAMQATSIWSARAGSERAPVTPAVSKRIVHGPPAFSRPGTQRPRVKYGPTAKLQEPASQPHPRARVKWGEWDSQPKQN